jgi:hypothetical protein
MMLLQFEARSSAPKAGVCAKNAQATIMKRNYAMAAKTDLAPSGWRGFAIAGNLAGQSQAGAFCGGLCPSGIAPVLRAQATFRFRSAL